jgi:hypothetical protein
MTLGKRERGNLPCEESYVPPVDWDEGTGAARSVAELSGNDADVAGCVRQLHRDFGIGDGLTGS